MGIIGDVVGDIMDYEMGALSQQQTLELFSKLVKGGMLCHLQGRYGRVSSKLIDAGYLDTEGDILKNV